MDLPWNVSMPYEVKDVHRDQEWDRKGHHFRREVSVPRNILNVGIKDWPLLTFARPVV